MFPLVLSMSSKETFTPFFFSFFLNYLFTFLNEGKTNLADIKLFFHVTLNYERNMYTKRTFT